MLMFDIIIGMLFLSGISMACLGLYGKRFADRIPAAVPYTLLMFTGFAWAIFYALDLLSESLPLKILFHNLRFLILPFIAVIELWLVIAFVKRTEWLRKDWAVAVLIIPVAAAILGSTSPLHTLFRYNFSIDSSGPVTVLHYTESPFYTMYILYSLVLLILAILILVIESRKRKTLWQEQTILLLIALAFPTVINYLFIFGLTPIQGVNMAAPLLWISAVLYTAALFRYHFLDIIPIARSRLIETMSTPMLVLDTGGRIIDLNPAACSLFSTTSLAAVGKPVNGIASDWPDFLMLCRSDGMSHSDLTHSLEGGTRFYTGSVEQILTPSGEPEGRLILLQDVTEQKVAEEALRESESFNRGLVENLPEYVIVYGPTGKILYVNPATERALGYNAVELTGTSVLSYVAPEYRDIATAKMAARREGSNPPAYEADIVAQDGLRRSIIAKGTPIQYHDSPAILLLLIDISERKRTEEALRESEERLRLLSDNLPNGMIYQIVIEPDGKRRFTHISAGIEKIHGVTVEDVIRDPMVLYNQFLEEDRARLAEVEDFAIRNLTVFKIEARYRMPDGQVRWSFLCSTPRQMPDESIIGDGFEIDITERKRAEEALKEHDEKIRLLLDSTAEAIYGLDMNGNCTFCNNSCLRLLGYKSTDELLGKNMHWQIHHKHPDGTHFPVEDCRIFRAFNKGEGTHVDDEVLWRSDGTSFPAEYWSYPQRHEGKVVGAVVTFIDITERKELEKEMEYHALELRQFSTSLASANKKLNLLSSITRHDINNQLTVLMGFLSLLKKKQPDPTLNEYCSKASNAAQRISAMIQFTKEYDAIGVSTPVWQDVRTVLDTAAKQAPLGKIIVKNDLPTGQEVFADPLVVKVFYNLMDNAVRYGGKITTIRFSVERSGDCHLIVCEDDGDGVVAGEKEKIFERGFGKNTGLGLALSREILSITGITIHETGEPGKGARFEITVPKDCYRFTTV